MNIHMYITIYIYTNTYFMEQKQNNHGVSIAHFDLLPDLKGSELVCNPKVAVVVAFSGDKGRTPPKKVIKSVFFILMFKFVLYG